MKKVIDGKLYNTATAEHLASYYNHKSASDFDLRDEDLYRTKKGTYFLVCCNGCRAGGDCLRPMTEDEAKEWVEAYANEAYCDIFGEPEEA